MKKLINIKPYKKIKFFSVFLVTIAFEAFICFASFSDTKTTNLTELTQNSDKSPSEENNLEEQNDSSQNQKTENIFSTENIETKNEEIKIETKSLDIEFSKEALNHPLTQKFIGQYKNEYSKKYLNAIMNNSLAYRGYVKQALENAQMPLCLQYLPVIESGYRINALSKSGARGLWQFMKNSVSPFGLRINSWMDERIDPWLSTDAAIKKLKENYDFFGNWELSLAAYNCGLGAVNRAVKASGVKDFWFLCDHGYLKSETKNYVPKFIAVSMMLENKELYGLNFEEPYEQSDESRSFDTIEVKKAVDLQVLAEKTEISKERLFYYNPSLTYQVTPPDMKYVLRLPEGTKNTVEQLLKTSMPLIKYHIYTVKSGDSLYALSLHYGIEVEDIQKINKLKNTTIKIGQNLMIPAIKDVGVYNHKIVNEKIDFSGTYTVNEKDTLYGIALQYNVQVELLASENNMEITDFLHKGDIIKVPILKDTAKQSTEPKNSAPQKNQKKK
ncbi:MAG: transglycosylase SLT domain-containing protein [Treponemataceae bacterium]